MKFLNRHDTMAGTQTFAHEISEKILKGGEEGVTFRRAWNKYKELSMVMMQTTEVAGRLGSMLAYHRKFRNTLEVERNAHQFSKDIHGTYERWNAPSWLKSDDPVMRFMKIPTFTFGTYVQNTYELLWHLMEKDRAALAWAVMMSTALGGFPLYKFVAFMSRMMGITQDPSMDTELTQLMGKTGKDMLKSGLIFSPLGLDASGQTNLGPPAVAQMAAVATGQTDALGDNIAVSSVKNTIETCKGFLDALLGRGPKEEIIKNFPVAAIRSAGKSFRDPEARGRPILVDGKPVELTPWERGATAMGFNPDRIASMQIQVFAVGEIAKDLNAEKNALEDEFLLAKGMQRAKVARKINEFNARLKSLPQEGGTMAMVRVRPINTDNIKPKKGINVIPREE
jgi:hypothetical protein